MTDDYARRLQRAEELAARMPEAAELLRFYIRVARLQSEVLDHVRGNAATDIAVLSRFIEPLMALLRDNSTVTLADFAREHTGSKELLLSEYWSGERDFSPEETFFARALIQPFAEYLASRGAPDTQTSAPVCPFCGAKPVAGVLRGEGDGGKRSLICSQCSTEWLYRRVSCPECSNEDKEKLPVYTAEGASIRIEACDSCKTYLKTVDMTKDGHAVPLVDELAAVVFSLRAADLGYAKPELNLLGM